MVRQQQNNTEYDTSKRPTIFYSYAHEDELLRIKLEKHLSVLRHEGKIAEWSAREILPGQDWQQEINKQLDEVTIFLLLISAHFMASNYCYGIEMKYALERQKRGAAHVIPILLSPVEWQKAPFAHLQCLPPYAKPVTKWSNQDEAFAKIAEGIGRVVEDITRNRTSTTQEPSSSTAFQPGQQLYMYELHTNRVISVAWAPDGTRIASGGLDGTVQVWSAKDGQRQRTYRGHMRVFPAPNVYTVSWSPDSTRIASAGNSATIHVWDATSGQKMQLYKGHSNILANIFHVSWSSNGKYIASTNMSLNPSEEAIHIWNAVDGHRLLKIDLRRTFTQTSSPGDVAWSPDGQLIAGSWNTKVRIYRVDTGKHIFTYENHDDWVANVAWSPDGKYLVSSANEKIDVWEAATGITCVPYINHGGNVRDVAWSPNGKYLASASNDRTVHVWESMTGKHILTYRGHTDEVTAVSWSPDGTRIASASNDGTVHVWQAPI